MNSNIHDGSIMHLCNGLLSVNTGHITMLILKNIVVSILLSKVNWDDLVFSLKFHDCL
ncbi:MAG: hypothetical protein K0S91_1372 [Nitrososphaeraceae archaeon]|jgi:hypothetical protein|nr:hypothetical protein [Nitrososphaeraceae archaeon]